MKHIIAVASGKGGVGKSTVAANLAISLANSCPQGLEPLRVALIDLDFYGPSIPTIMGGGEIGVDSDKRIIPADKYRVKYISIAFFLKNIDDPIIWRGPRFGTAIRQLFDDVAWGDIDIAIVDMPPGTGDAQLSLCQLVQLSGAIIVTTPQELAIVDVRRAINMFGQVNVKILGIIENMSGYKLPSGDIINIFGDGGGAQLSAQFNIPLLGSIPIDINVREAGDIGHPIVLNGASEISKVYNEIALGLQKTAEALQINQPKLTIVE